MKRSINSASREYQTLLILPGIQQCLNDEAFTMVAVN